MITSQYGIIHLIKLMKGKDMNIIDAIVNLVNNPINELQDYYSSKNRANNMGDSLEEYVKDLFANSFDLSEKDRLDKISNTFSYLGNNSNPPDAMLKGGDAIEVKKIESLNASLALNSSYPKQFLYADSPMISRSCKVAENWEKKDLIYSVGVVSGKELKHLCFIYGSDYAADDETYSRVKTKIKDGVESIPNVEFSVTRELGRVNRVDPLGITYLRVRGMWGIENPWSVFNYVYQRDLDADFNFMCIISDLKWFSFSNRNELYELADKTDSLKISNIKIKNPDNPAQLRNAKLVTFKK